MDAQGFAQWIQQNRMQAPAVAGQAMRPGAMQPPAPPPRPTFDPSQGAPPGMGSMGGKPGQFGNEVPGTVGPQYGPGGTAGGGQRFSPQASSGNIFEAPERGGKPGNSSQPMGVKNAPNLFGKGPSAGPSGPTGPGRGNRAAGMGAMAQASAGPGFSAPMRPVNPGVRPVSPVQSRGPAGPGPNMAPGSASHPFIPGTGSMGQLPIGIGGVPIPKAGG